ncbi:MAG: TatD family hydrolase [Bacteroidia bacterium]
MKFIDLHTHRLTEADDIQILNIFAQDIPKAKPEFLFSAGLHPWHIEKVNPEECISEIERISGMKNFVAIGECGLDRSVSTDFALQEMIFKEQIRVAENQSKCLIIHCVRAYSDIINLKIQTKSEVPWILHGYSGNMETTWSLIRHGFYFSVGERLLKNVSSHSVLRTIPTERLFMETDDSEISIRQIYLSASQILKIENEILINLIFRNFKAVFGNETGS